MRNTFLTAVAVLYGMASAADPTVTVTPRETGNWEGKL